MRKALAVLAASFMPWVALAEESAISWWPGALQGVKSGTGAKSVIAKSPPAKNAKVDWSRVVSLSPGSVTVMEAKARAQENAVLGGIRAAEKGSSGGRGLVPPWVAMCARSCLH